jgi:eukaryotic-like serine/threonine-protein kinase
MRPGELVAQRFELLELAGRGASGTVWQARDRSDGSTLALKIVELARAGQDRFAREARVLATLQHPGIVRYIGHGPVDEQLAYLAMEWLDGAPMSSALASRGQLPLAVAIDLVRRVARALGAAHRAGIVHRDLKPANVFLIEGKLDRPKLLDFGIAFVPDALNPTRTGATLGTLGYLSPEQVGKNAPVSARSDVFSLGCMLYECLAGSVPFAAETPVAAVAKTLLEDPPPLRSQLAQAPEALERLLEELLAKESEDRPADAAIVAERLQAVLDQIGEAPAPRPLGSALSIRPQQLGTAVVVRGAALDAEPIRRLLESIQPGIEWQVERLGVDGLRLISAGVDPLERASLAARAASAIVARHRRSAAVALVSSQRIAELDEAALASASAPGFVCVDPATAELLPASFGVVRLEGRSVLEQRLFAPVDRRGRGHVPLVGRKRELRVLRVVAESVFEDSYPGLALIIGETGSGKTVLWRELVRELTADGHQFMTWRCGSDPERKNAPWSAIADGTRRLLGLRNDELAGSATARLDAWVRETFSGADAERVRDFLGELVGLPLPGDPSPLLSVARRDPAIMNFEIERAVLDMTRSMTAKMPLLAVFDDVHWCDSGSVQLVSSTLERLRDLPILVIATADSSVERRFPGLWRAHNPQQIRLEALSERASRTLATALLQDQSPDRIEQVVSRAEGNPLLLQELALAARERPDDELPLGVRALIGQRIERLEPDAQQVLMAASVLGTVFWRGAIEGLVSHDVARDLDSWLQILEQAEVIRKLSGSRYAGQPEYELSHRLMASVAYDMLSDDAKRAAHASVAVWLQSVGERQAAVVARHAEAGGGGAAAAALWCRAAEQALEAHDMTAAITLAEHAIGSGASGVWLGRARLVMAKVHETRSEPEQAERQARTAMQELPPDTEQRYEAIRCIAITAFRLERAEHLEPLAAELFQALPTGGVAAGQAAVTTAMSLLLLNRDSLGARLLEALDACPQFESVPAIAARIASARAAFTRRSRDLLGQLHHYETCARLLALDADERSTCTAANNLGVSLRYLGQLDQARVVLEQALASADRIGATVMAASLHYNLAAVALQQGALSDAITHARQSVDASSQGRVPRIECLSRAHLARALLESGKLEDAEVEAAQAVETKIAPSSARAYACSVLARVLAARDRVAEADAASAEAMALQDPEGPIEEGDLMIPLTRAEVLWRLGRADEARATVAEAIRTLEQTAALITEPAARSAYLTALTEHPRLYALRAEYAAS